MSTTTADRIAVRSPRNGMGVAALVVGVVALVLAILIVFFPIAGLLGIVAIILGAIGMARASRGEADNRGQALAGLITGLLALLIAIGLGIGIGGFLTAHANDFRKLGTCWNKADNRVERQACVRIFGKNVDD